MAVRLYGMTCGYLTLPAGALLEGDDGDVTVPIPSYLVEHPKGTVVFDTGFEIALQDPNNDRDETLGPLAPVASTEFHPGDDVAGRLSAAGHDPGQIDFMVNSHLHLDHAGGNALLPNARWIIQAREWAEAHTSEAQEKHFYRPRLFDLGHDRIEADGEYDIFGDGTVLCIPTYGHTKGHQSLKVKLEEGEVILTADACYMCRSLDDMVLPPGFLDNAEDMLCNLHKFSDFRKRGGALIFGHDPAQWATVTDGPLKEISLGNLTERKAGVVVNDQ